MIKIIDLHRTDYADAFTRQEKEFNRIIRAKREGLDFDEIIFLTEHNPVYTLGLHGHPENLLASENQLADSKIQFFHTNRGGDITYHGPGQLVVYPIIDLQQYGLGVKDYVNLLEECVIRTVGEYGIKAGRSEGAPGVWIDVAGNRERKICALGVKCSRYVTMHGFALNVNTDMRYFSSINPCGFTDKGVTSVSEEVGRVIDIEEVKDLVVKFLQQLLRESAQRHNLKK